MLRALAVVLLAACSTIETENLIRHERRTESCKPGQLVATAFPGDWPDVVIDLRDEVSCETPVDETFEVTRQLKPMPIVGPIVGAVLGGAAGIAAQVVLGKTASATPRDSSSYGTFDAAVILPFVGVLGGAMVVAALNPPRPTQTLSTQVHVVTSFERRRRQYDGTTGELSWANGPVAHVRGGQAHLPVELAARVYGRPLSLNGRPVEWSVRREAWVPGILPACARAAAAKASADIEQASAVALDGMAGDARVCGNDGWSFAEQWLNVVLRAKAQRASDKR